MMVGVVVLLPLVAAFLVYNNDLTNIESCTSPYHRGVARDGEPFTQKMLKASVDETAGRGISIHALAPGCCFVPWWNNASVISIPQHVAWWTHTFYKKDGTLPPNRTEGYMEFLMRGGDILEPFIRYVRAAGMQAFVSWRMNDAQAFSHYETRPLEDQFKDTAKFWYENRHNASMNLGPTQNWASSVVRDYKTSMLNDIIHRYAPDGISLDFLRAPVFFNLSTTTAHERLTTMMGWVRAVRAEMRAAGVGTLAARIPPDPGTLSAIGVNATALVGDGTLDYLTLGVGYYSFMPMDAACGIFVPCSGTGAVAPSPPLVAGATALWEITYVERAKPSASCSHGPDQRMTVAHLATSALQAYALGATGIASFNFQYYRPFADMPCQYDENKPYSEPPFEILAKLKDRSWLATQHQFYWSNKKVPLPFRRDDVLLVPPTDGWRRDGKLRVNLQANHKKKQKTLLLVVLNGQPLQSTSNTSFLWPSEQPDRFAGEYLAWTVPVSVPREGNNVLEISTAAAADAAAAAEAAGAAAAAVVVHFDVMLPAASSWIGGEGESDETELLYESY